MSGESSGIPIIDLFEGLITLPYMIVKIILRIFGIEDIEDSGEQALPRDDTPIEPTKPPKGPPRQESTSLAIWFINAFWEMIFYLLGAWFFLVTLFIAPELWFLILIVWALYLMVFLPTQQVFTRTLIGL